LTTGREIEAKTTIKKDKREKERVGCPTHCISNRGRLTKKAKRGKSGRKKAA